MRLLCSLRAASYRGATSRRSDHGWRDNAFASAIVPRFRRRSTLVADQRRDRYTACRGRDDSSGSALRDYQACRSEIGKSAVQVRSSAPFFQKLTEQFTTACCTTAVRSDLTNGVLSRPMLPPDQPVPATSRPDPARPGVEPLTSRLEATELMKVCDRQSPKVVISDRREHVGSRAQCSVYKVSAETFDLLKENPESDSLEVADVRSRKL